MKKLADACKKLREIAVVNLRDKVLWFIVSNNVHCHFSRIGKLLRCISYGHCKDFCAKAYISGMIVDFTSSSQLFR